VCVKYKFHASDLKNSFINKIISSIQNKISTLYSLPLQLLNLFVIDYLQTTSSGLLCLHLACALIQALQRSNFDFNLRKGNKFNANHAWSRFFAIFIIS